MMSAYTFLAGLYPPTERQMWHPDIPWQPIPVHSLPREMDNVSIHQINQMQLTAKANIYVY